MANTNTEPKPKNKFLQKIMPDSVTIFKLGMQFAPKLPFRVGNFICDLIGVIGYYLVKSKRKAVLCNLSHVLPDKTLAERRKVARGIFKNNIRNYYDIFRVHSLTTEKITEQVKVYGLEDWYVKEQLNRGIICYSAHTGSFSFVLNASSYYRLKFNMVVEPIKPPELFDLIRKQRENFPDARIIAVGSPEVRNIFRALKRNEIVCIAIDRDVIGTGKPIKFFDKETNLPFGAAELAIKTGALVFSVHSFRRPDGISEARFSPVYDPVRTGDTQADIQNLMEYMVRHIEEIIRAHPQDWVMLSPVWDDCQ
jgi:lauroyl/myristoyl acyltransferase